MRKCNVCGKRFRLLAKNRYEIMKCPVGIKFLTEETIYYAAFDCPYCGCQNIVQRFDKVTKGMRESEGEDDKRTER